MTTAYTLKRSSVFMGQRIRSRLRYGREAIKHLADSLHTREVEQLFPGIDQTDYVNYLYQNVWEQG